MDDIHINGVYRHFKGNIYQLIMIAKHSETLEDMVVYKTLYGDFGYWVRKKDMFFENVCVNVNGIMKQVPRFKYIGEMDTMEDYHGEN